MEPARDQGHPGTSGSGDRSTPGIPQAPSRCRLDGPGPARGRRAVRVRGRAGCGSARPARPVVLETDEAASRAIAVVGADDLVERHFVVLAARADAIAVPLADRRWPSWSVPGTSRRRRSTACPRPHRRSGSRSLIDRVHGVRGIGKRTNTPELSSGLVMAHSHSNSKSPSSSAENQSSPMPPSVRSYLDVRFARAAHRPTFERLAVEERAPAVLALAPVRRLRDPAQAADQLVLLAVRLRAVPEHGREPRPSP